MYTLLICYFNYSCNFMIIIMVLMQSSKGGGLAGTFGGAGMGTMFGTRRTADFLSKATWWLAGSLAVLDNCNKFFLSARYRLRRSSEKVLFRDQDSRTFHRLRLCLRSSLLMSLHREIRIPRTNNRSKLYRFESPVINGAFLFPVCEQSDNIILNTVVKS